MCIIVYKPMGVKMPSRVTLENCFENNPDGAGLMFPINGKVRIVKGFMTLGAMLSAVDALKDVIDVEKTPVIMHFRIGTHGGMTAEQCHPFPVTDNATVMSKPRINCPVGVAHNGIIYGMGKDAKLSDTMLYIRDYLSLIARICPDYVTNDAALQLIANEIDSKMILLDGTGKVGIIGDFQADKGGVMYSNGTYQYVTYSKHISPTLYSASLYDKTADGILLRATNDKTPKTVWVMPLFDGEYLKNEKGELVDCDGNDLYYMDINKNVYRYDFEFSDSGQGAVIPCVGFEAFTSNGTPVIYDPSDTERMRVLT
jgi:hypothetical protein